MFGPALSGGDFVIGYPINVTAARRSPGKFNAIHAFALRLLLVGSATLLPACNSTNTGEDSWQHYKTGGLFITSSPSLSPDGRSLVYASVCTGHGDIYVFRDSESDPVCLTNNEDFESSPMFTPDGKHIIFVREHDQRRHIWKMNSDGTQANALTDGDTLDDPLSVSRDGRYLSFTRATKSGGLGKLSRAFVMRVDETADAPVEVGIFPVFSPDSRFLVYSDAGELWRVQLDGPERTRSRVYGTGWPMDISDDGKTILTVRRTPGTGWNGDDEIWSVDTDRKSEKELARGQSPVLFGENKTHVFFLSGSDQTPFVTRTQGGTPKRIECPSGYKTHPRICLNGRGVIVGSFAKHSGPEYDAVLVDLDNLQTSTICSIKCGSSAFHAPVN